MIPVPSHCQQFPQEAPWSRSLGTYGERTSRVSELGKSFAAFFPAASCGASKCSAIHRCFSSGVKCMVACSARTLFASWANPNTRAPRKTTEMSRLCLTSHAVLTSWNEMFINWSLHSFIAGLKTQFGGPPLGVASQRPPKGGTPNLLRRVSMVF